MISVLDPEGAAAVRAAAAKDLSATRAEFLFPLPPSLAKRVTKHMYNPRDLPIVHLYFNIAVLTVPAAAALFAGAPASHAAGAAYLILNYVLFLQRFMLALHYSEHRRLFRSPAANAVAPLLLAPLFGIPSGMYWVHHCLMHHGGGNAAGVDASSTEPYHRGSIPHFLIYWARHFLFGLVEVPLAAAQRKRWGVLAACLATETAYFTVIAALWRVAPIATAWVFLAPYLVSSLALMFGNWSQHVFIDPSRPRSPYGLTYNCLACPDNTRSFNDGYHAVHHANAGVHWTDLPSKFVDTLEEHGAAECLVFVGIGFFDVGAAVLGRRWRFLASKVARYTKKMAAMTEDEVIEELQRRLGPVRT